VHEDEDNARSFPDGWSRAPSPQSPSPPPPSPPSGARLDDRFAESCIECGYALAGLDRAGSCPECGSPVAASDQALRGGLRALEVVAYGVGGAYQFAFFTLAVGLLLIFPSLALPFPCACVVVVALIVHAGGLVAAGLECSRMSDAVTRDRSRRMAVWGVVVLATAILIVPLSLIGLASRVLTEEMVIAILLGYAVCHMVATMGIGLTMAEASRVLPRSETAPGHLRNAAIVVGVAMVVLLAAGAIDFLDRWIAVPAWLVWMTAISGGVLYLIAAFVLWIGVIDVRRVIEASQRQRNGL
jgi:hypothetical protein